MEISWPVLMCSSDGESFLAMQREQTLNKKGINSMSGEIYFYDVKGNKFLCESLSKKHISWRHLSDILLLNPSYEVDYEVKYLEHLNLAEFKGEILPIFKDHRNAFEKQHGDPDDSDQEYLSFYVKSIQGAKSHEEIIKMFL